MKRSNDFQALRAKFQEHDVINNKLNDDLKLARPESLQAPDATAASDSKIGVDINKINIFETVNTHNATIQQSKAKSPPSLPLAKRTVASKQLPEWIKHNVPVEGRGRPEDFVTSNLASMNIQTVEHKVYKNNRGTKEEGKIALKEKINIWENSSHNGIAASTPGQKIKCSTLPPSVINSRSKPLLDSPYKVTYLVQGKKFNARMGAGEKVSGDRNKMSQFEETITVNRSCEDSQAASNTRLADSFSQLEINHPVPQNDQKTFKQDNTLESEPLDPVRLDVIDCCGSKPTNDQREQEVMERNHSCKSLQRLEPPPIEELGPPPVKPPRPFKIDLSALWNLKIDSFSLETSENSDTPSSPITHPEKDEIQRSDAQEANDEKVQHFRQMEQEGDLQNRVSEEKQMDQMKEHGNKKREKELQKKFNLTGSEVPIHKVQIQEYLKGGKFNLEVKPGEMVEIIRMVDCPAGKWVARTQDGNYGYVQIDAVKMNNDEIKEINNRISKSPHVMEKIYDDVGLSDISVEHPRKVLDNVECGQCQETTDIKNELEKNRTNTMNCLTKILQKKKEKKVTDESPSQTQQFERGLASNTYDNAISEVTASLISNSQSHLADKESLHEEIYDDVEPDSSGARKKGRIKELGRRFKKEINDGGKEKKIKNKDKAMDHLSVNSRSESTLAIMNLDSERSLYEEISNLKELDDSKDKSSKSDTIKIRWGKIFRKRGENAKRTEDMKLEESEREKVKEKFKVKKKDLNEQTKVNKKKMLNEQDFRENFNYTKEILVENTAVVECNVMQEQKGSLYLPLKLGERLDVIDIGEENLIICRNSEGKYGYVHVQHLSFGT
ncbi:FYN-binding protein 2-like isoform X2 [Narcine bancroftii]|uniref:FYN-binding protein 2-like isoform X2 n=1 Tax=Narcine bancroftii TaxID=1343680 RepID=UPI003831D64A